MTAKLFTNKSNSDGIIKTISVAVIPPYRENLLLKQLNEVKQVKYSTWSEYVEKIDKIIQKNSITKNLSSLEKKKKKRRNIKLGLHKETTHSLFVKGVAELNDIISNLEDLIISNESNFSQKKIK